MTNDDLMCLDGSDTAPAMTLAEYVALFMQANKGTRKYDIAKRLGVTPAYLSELMAGRKLPSLRLAHIISLRTGGSVRLDSWSRQIPGNV